MQKAGKFHGAAKEKRVGALSARRDSSKKLTLFVGAMPMLSKPSLWSWTILKVELTSINFNSKQPDTIFGVRLFFIGSRVSLTQD